MTDENAEAAWREAAHRGLIAHTQGDLARAIEAFSAALALRPDDANLRFYRALS
jgi:Flp pilus assembly protein TadD